MSELMEDRTPAREIEEDSSARERRKPMTAAEALGTRLQVVNMPWLNRLDIQWFTELVEPFGELFVVEDHSPVGALGDTLRRALDGRAVTVFGVEGWPACGTPLEARHHEDRERPTCPSCGFIHYLDPKVAVAVVLGDERGVLLCRRLIDPGSGLWSFPAGYVNRGEVLEEAAGSRRRSVRNAVKPHLERVRLRRRLADGRQR